MVCSLLMPVERDMDRNHEPSRLWDTVSAILRCVKKEAGTMSSLLVLPTVEARNGQI